MWLKKKNRIKYLSNFVSLLEDYLRLRLIRSGERTERGLLQKDEKTVQQSAS